MPIRFQADADFNQIIVSAVVRRYPEIDFRTATAAGLAGLEDTEVLALAERDARILATHDYATMPQYFGEFIRTTPSPGLIVVEPRGSGGRRRSHPHLDSDTPGGVDQPDRLPAHLKRSRPTGEMFIRRSVSAADQLRRITDGACFCGSQSEGEPE